MWLENDFLDDVQTEWELKISLALQCILSNE